MDSTLRFQPRAASRLILIGAMVAAGLSVLAFHANPTAVADGASTTGLPEHFVLNGPAPMISGSDDADINRWAGAVDAIIADPVAQGGHPRQVWIGTVNGGVWRSRNLDVLHPSDPVNWRPLSDHQSSLSIGGLALDPTRIDPGDENGRTLVAGFGAQSSVQHRTHGPTAGVMRSTDAGDTWTQEPSRGLTGAVTGVLVRGPVIIASTSTGVFRSDNFGDNFSPVITTGAVPLVGSAMSLVEDPAHLDRAFVAVLGDGGGVFRVDDLTDPFQPWTLVEPLTAFGPDAEDGTKKVVMSAEDYPTPGGDSHTVVFGGMLGITDEPPSGEEDGDAEESGLGLTDEFRSEQGGAAGSWQIFGPVSGVVLQQQSKLAVAEDPGSETTVYLSGDQGDTFRCEVGSSALDCVGIATGVANHFDRRVLTFDDGQMLVGNDGGVFERTNPRDIATPGSWYQRQGDLAITESYVCAYDDLAQVTGCANQDNGVAIQDTPGADVWTGAGPYGDGTVFAVSDAPRTCLGGQACSTRYYSGQDLRDFTRARCNAANVCDVHTHDTGPGDTDAHPALLDTDAVDADGNPTEIDIGCVGFPVDPVCGDPNLQFLTPVAANPTDGDRVITASGADHTGKVYESFDGAEHFSELTGFTGAPSGAILYGGATDPDAIYVGSDEGLFVRGGPGHAVTQSSTFHVGVMGNPTAVAVDPRDVNSAWVVTDQGRVLHSDHGTDPAAHWVPVTGLLTPGGPNATGLRSVAVVPVGSVTAVLVGGYDGLYLADSNQPKTWFKLSGELPNVIVSSLQYDVKNDLLVIGTIGRSSWLMKHASQMNLPAVLNASASDDSGDFNDPVHFSARLTDAQGVPVAGEPVHFVLGDGSSTQACDHDPVTDSNGVASCTVVLTLDPGDYSLTASSPGHGDLVVSSLPQPFQVTKDETAIQYTGPRSGDTHDPVHVTATIFDPDGGAPIAGKRVTFAIGNPVLGQQCTSDPSDADGHVGCDITPFQPAGDYQVVADFVGTRNYQASQSPPVTFTILREESHLSLDPPPHLLNGASATFGATLVEDTAGPPIGGVPVTFTLGSGSSAQTCSHDTDINGHVSCTFPMVSQPSATVPVLADFAGDSFYLLASASGTSALAYYQGRATALSFSQTLLLPLSFVAADTGLITTLDASHTERHQVSINNPVVSIKVLDSSVDTGGGVVTSTATVSGVTISATGLPLITLTALSSTASATCNASFVASATARTTLGMLRVGLVPVVLTGGPNQTVNLGIAKLVLNEQRPLPGTSAGISVNGLHLTGPGLDVVVSHAQAAVLNCP